MATALAGYIIGGLTTAGASFINYLPNLFWIAATGAGAYYALRALKFIFDEVEKGTLTVPGFYSDWAAPTYNLVRVLVILFALMLAFPYLPGSGSPAFQGISIFIDFLASLGSSSVVANIVAGIVLTYTRAFKVGDRVSARIADRRGACQRRCVNEPAPFVLQTRHYGAWRDGNLVTIPAGDLPKDYQQPAFHVLKLNGS